MHKYRLVAKKGEGTFSEVLKAQCIKNGKYVAIKCMKNHFDSLDQVNNLREIQALRRLSPHPNIIKLLEVLYDQPTGRLALVMELMDMNIYELIRGRRHYVAEERLKNYMYQLMKAMDHMHRNGIFHRDIKPENVLIMDDCLKLADFGSCRGIYSKQPYTEYISTRWYRAPECLLTDGYYNYKMDMWGVGCVFFEIVSLFPLFPGTNELDQITKIHNILGTPPPELLAKLKKRSQHIDFNFPHKEGTGVAKLIPHASPECIDLIVKLLAYNPDDRLSARQALRHPYFKELRDAEKRQKALMTPDVANHFGSGSMEAAGDSKGHSSGRHQASSAAGSDAETGANLGASMGTHGGGSSPPDGRNSDTHGLPSIGGAKHQPSGMPLMQHHSDAHHHGGGVSGDEVQGSTSQYNLHAQSSADNVAGEEGSLPPIGNLSLGKANMSVNQTARRVGGTLPTYYDAPQGYQKAKIGAAGAPKRQPGMIPPVNKYKQPGGSGVVQQVGVGVGGVGGSVAPSNASGSYKYKANAKAGGAPGASGSAKYITPFSLRQLAGKD